MSTNLDRAKTGLEPTGPIRNRHSVRKALRKAHAHTQGDPGEGQPHRSKMYACSCGEQVSRRKSLAVGKGQRNCKTHYKTQKG